MQKSSSRVAFAVGITFLLAPFGLIYISFPMMGPPVFWVLALLWGFSISDMSLYFGFYPMPWLPVLFSAFYIPFAYMVVRCCQGQATKRATYLMGILGMLPFPIFGIWYSYVTGILRVLFVPLPVLLLVGLVLIATCR